ncbi:MAG: cytochrome c [Methylococcales bacterium]|nr:cytochrome c [Methylococcales bacterium]
MKKILITAAMITLIGLSSPSFAASDADLEKIGKKIYDRAFGRGCGTCHDIASNPQLAALIKGGNLDKAKFAKILREGKNGMPAALKNIMGIKPVIKAGLSEDEAIDAVYKFLSK